MGIMAEMKHLDVRDDLADGFEITKLPLPGPDGGLDLPPQRPPRRDPPRLCSAGPCKHYHRMVTQLDAQAPLALPARRARELGVLPDSMPGFHTEAHHYCYPTAGVETNLGETPVVSCSLYEPVHMVERRRIDAARSNFLQTPEGQEYAAELERWRAALAEDRALEAAAAAQAAADLANMPTSTPDPAPAADPVAPAPVAVRRARRRWSSRALMKPLKLRMTPHRRRP